MSDFLGRPDEKPFLRLVRVMVFGAAISLLATVVLAGIFAVVFRFPVPLAGYASGPHGFGAGILSGLIYTAIGGWIPQAILGSMGGVLADIYAHRRHIKSPLVLVVFATVAALPGVLTLSVLDWIIGDF